MVNKLRWFLIRRLLTISERVDIHEACNDYCESQYKHSLLERGSYEWSQDNSRRASVIKNRVAGKINLDKWS